MYAGHDVAASQLGRVWLERHRLGVVEVFEVPVFLQFEHESEADAVAAAEPVIRRHLTGLLRQHLGAEPARW